MHLFLESLLPTSTFKPKKFAFILFHGDCSNHLSPYLVSLTILNVFLKLFKYLRFSSVPFQSSLVAPQFPFTYLPLSKICPLSSSCCFLVVSFTSKASTITHPLMTPTLDSHIQLRLQLRLISNCYCSPLPNCAYK